MGWGTSARARRQDPILLPPTESGVGQGLASRSSRGCSLTSVILPFYRAHMRREPCHRGNTQAAWCQEVWFVVPAVCRSWLGAPAAWQLETWAQESCRETACPRGGQAWGRPPHREQGTQVPAGPRSKSRVTPGSVDCLAPAL